MAITAKTYINNIELLDLYLFLHLLSRFLMYSEYVIPCSLLNQILLLSPAHSKNAFNSIPFYCSNYGLIEFFYSIWRANNKIKRLFTQIYAYTLNRTINDFRIVSVQMWMPNVFSNNSLIIYLNLQMNDCRETFNLNYSKLRYIINIH